MAVINNEKYYSFENRAMLENLCLRIDSLKIVDVKIKNQNNPAQLKDAKLIKYSV